MKKIPEQACGNNVPAGYVLNGYLQSSVDFAEHKSSLLEKWMKDEECNT